MAYLYYRGQQMKDHRPEPMRRRQYGDKTTNRGSGGKEENVQDTGKDREEDTRTPQNNTDSIDTGT